MNKILKSLVITALLTTPLFAFASEVVMCPPVDMIAQAWKLDTVSIFDTEGQNDYVAFSMEGFDYANYKWHVFTSVLEAPSMDAALVAGQDKVKTVGVPLTDESLDLGQMLLCGYSSTDAKDSSYIGAVVIKVETAETGFKFNFKNANLRKLFSKR